MLQSTGALNSIAALGLQLRSTVYRCTVAVTSCIVQHAQPSPPSSNVDTAHRKDQASPNCLNQTRTLSGNKAFVSVLGWTVSSQQSFGSEMKPLLSRELCANKDRKLCSHSYAKHGAHGWIGPTLPKSRGVKTTCVSVRHLSEFIHFVLPFFFFFNNTILSVTQGSVATNTKKKTGNKPAGYRWHETVRVWK